MIIVKRKYDPYTINRKWICLLEYIYIIFILCVIFENPYGSIFTIVLNASKI